MNNKIFGKTICAILTYFYLLDVTIEQIVRISIDPYYSNTYIQGSMYGGLRIFIKGSGFDVIGMTNQVLAGTTPCHTINYYTTETQLVCQLEEGSYDHTSILPLRVFSYGSEIPCGLFNCSVRFSDRSPYISAIIPGAIYPGQNFKIRGLLRVSNTDEILQFKVGLQNCELPEDAVSINQWSRSSTIECKTFSDLIPGEHSLRFESKYGIGFAQVMETSSLFNLSTGNKYHLRVHPVISELSANEGYASGQYITIKGSGFGVDEENITVEIDGIETKIISVADDLISIELGEAVINPNQHYFIGGAGLEHRFYYTTDNINNFQNRDEYPDQEGYIQDVMLTIESYPDDSNYIQRYKGLFCAPKTGVYKFFISSDDQSQVKFSKTPYNKEEVVDEFTDFDILCEVTGWTSWRRFFGISSILNCEKEMEAGECYHIIALHKEFQGNDHLNLRIHIPNDDSNAPNRSYQINKITITNDPIYEQIVIKIWNATSGTFRLLFQNYNDDGDLTFDRITENIDYPPTAKQLRDEIQSATGWNSNIYSRKNIDSNGDELDEDVLTEEEMNDQTKGYAYYITFTSTRSQRISPFFINTALEKNPDAENIEFFTEVTVEPSPPVTGDYKLQIGEDTTENINVNSGETTYEDILRDLPSLKDGVHVKITGNVQHTRTIYIEFVSIRGEAVDVTIVDNNVTGGPVENPVQIQNEVFLEATNDMFSPSIPSELLFSISEKPQIRVKVNNIYAACPKNKCDYEIIDESQIPIIDSFSLNQAELNITLDQAYENLEYLDIIIAKNINVEFGGSKCIVDSVELPLISCNLPINTDDTPIIEAGNHVPKLHLDSKGFFKINALEQSFDLTLDSINPVEAGSNGGIIITITGSGFGDSMTVTVNNSECNILSIENQSVDCIVPPDTLNDGTTLTKIMINGKEAETDIFSYNPALTPVINSLSPNNASPVLKSTLTINGDAFGSDKEKVKITLQRTELYEGKLVEYDCNVLSINDTELTCVLSGGFSGEYKVILTKNDVGTNRVANEGDDIFKYEITIDSVHPQKGSTKGGTELTITGNNFSTIANQNQILIGEGDHYCDITSATKTELICITRPAPSEMSGVQTVHVLGRIIEDAKCTGTCNFEYDIAVTPTVTNLSASDGIAGDDITVTGTNFESSDNVIVKLDNLEAIVTSSDDTTITFTLPEYVASTRTLTILVPGKGQAKFEVNAQITNNLVYTDVNPKSGPRGGNILTISGNGFDPNSSLVYAEAKHRSCLIKSITPIEIKCELTLLPFSNQTYEILIEQNSNTLQCEGCEYTTTDLPPYITSVSTTVFDTPNSLSFVISGVRLTSIDPETVSVSLKNRNYTDIEINGTADYVQDENNEGSITLSFTNVPIGTYDIKYYIEDFGFAFVSDNDNFITVELNDNVEIDQTVSSFNGGSEVTIRGNGFVDKEDLFSIIICGRICEISSITFDEVKCLTPKLISQSTNDAFKLIQKKLIEPLNINQSSISNIDNLNDADFGTAISSNSDDCNFTYDFGEGNIAFIERIRLFPQLNSDEKYLNGAQILGSNDDVNYDVLATLINTIENWNEYNPEEGTWNYRYIRFYGRKCRISEFEVEGFLYYNEATVNLDSHLCSLSIKTETKTIVKSDIIEYRLDNTPIVLSLDPKLGTTIGGTIVSITGNRFDPQNSEVLIDDIPCPVDIDASSSDLLVCTTGVRPEFVEPTLVIKTPTGYAATQGLTYLYIDRWSDEATWGGEAIPREGDSVYVPKGQNLLVDVSTPVLKAVIVEGSIIWEDVKDLTFDAHIIFVRGGSLRIGTAEQPHQHKLIVTLHGEKTDMTLPNMGNKLIGSYTGTIDIHGKKRLPTWTLLESTVMSGATSLTVIEEVDWEAGETIIISPTNNNRNNFETLTITSVSEDKKTINFEPPLQHPHFADTLTYDGKTFEVRAEVALITRNVLIRGDENSIQTKYGVHIMMRGRGVIGRFSYIEVTRCGQAFQMGRYPIHFHMIGNVIGSYIEGCSVHHSFNRGSTIHGVHYLKVIKNVYYQHLGHGIFIEDSVESNNIISENLIMRTSVSSSLLGSDLKPAGIWITRPNNFITKNRACGSEAFGFWYDLPNHPTGPSANNSICLIGEPLGSFSDNIAHTNTIGLRIYPIYIPRTNPCGGISNNTLLDPFSQNPPVLAEFKNILVFSNSTGFFGREIGAIKLDNFGIISNGQGVVISEPHNAPLNMPRLVNSVIVSESPLTTLHGNRTGTGFISSRKDGFLLENVRFINFSSGFIIGACDSCEMPRKFDRGGRLTTFKNISFENVTSNFIRYNDALRDKDIFKDEDGSLGKHIGFDNSEGGWIVPYFKHLDIPECTKIEDTNICNETCLYCSNAVDIKRVDIQLFENISLLRGLTLKIFNLDINENFSVDTESNDNYSLIPAKDANGFIGWAVPFASGYKYNLHWQEGVDFTVIDILNDYTWQPNDGSVMLRFNNTNTRELYDVFFTGIDDTNYIQNELISASENKPGVDEGFGNHYYDDNIFYLKVDRKERRGNVKVRAVICRMTCPEDDDDESSEDEFRYWSNPLDWPNGALPKDGDDVTIESAWKMVLDVPSAKLKILRISGTLIVDSTKENLELNAFNIHIMKNGSLLVGTDTTPFTNNFTINLFGSFTSESVVIGPVIEPPNKALIVAGQLKLYGVKKSPVWTRLSENGIKGSTNIKVADDTDWKVGDELVIASTSMNPDEVEYVTIQSVVDNNTFTIDKGLQFNHYGSANPINTEYGYLDMRAEVGVLSRNIKIIGANDSDWGCRVLTARYQVFDSDTNSLVFIEGNSIIQGVEMNGCGQRDTLHGALDFQFLKGPELNIIDNIVIRNSSGIGLNMLNSAYIHFTNSIITNVRRYGVYTRNIEQIKFDDNLIVKIAPRPTYNNNEVYDVHVGFYYDNIDKLADKNVFINRNSISATEWFAWVIPGHTCNTVNNNFKDNIGHTARAGWFSGDSVANCAAYSHFIGYKNFDEGFVNRFDIHQLYVSNMILADNANSIAINGGSSSDKKYPMSHLSDTVIYGKALSNCSFCYQSKKECMTNGIYTSLFEKIDFDFKFNEFRLPLHNTTFTDYLWGGKQFIENVAFHNFRPTNVCNETFTIRSNNFVQDTSAAVFLKNIKLFNVDEANYFYFFNHTRVMHSDFCNKRDCTGIYNIILNDATGSYFNEPTNFFGYNRGIAKDGNCTFRSEWNGHACKNKYMLLSMEQPGTTRQSIISPIKFRVYQFDADVSDSDKYVNTVDNETKFPIIIKRNSYNNVGFSQSMPTGVIYKLDSSNINDWAIFRVQITDPATLITVVNGKRIESLIVREDEEINLIDHKNNCGTNIYFPSNTTLTWIQNARSNCIVRVVKTSSVRINMRLDINVFDFYKDVGTTSFIDRMAALLNIPTNRLKIVGVRTGSTVIDFIIFDKNSDNEDSSADVQELRQIRDELISKVSSGALDSIAPVLGIEANVIETRDDGTSSYNFSPHCRFYSFSEYSLINTEVEESEKASEKPSTYVSVVCDNCENNDACNKLLSTACEINKNLIGATQCYENFECEDCDDAKSSLLLTYKMLFLVMNLILLYK